MKNGTKRTKIGKDIWYQPEDARLEVTKIRNNAAMQQYQVFKKAHPGYALTYSCWKQVKRLAKKQQISHEEAWHSIKIQVRQI